MFELLDKVKHLDLVILNAGVFGKMSCIKDVSLEEVQKTMDINLWGNKLLLEWLLKHLSVKQVIAISSGAAVNG